VRRKLDRLLAKACRLNGTALYVTGTFRSYPR
jgi:hypothetical protein